MQNVNFTSKPSTKEKVMSYEEKSVGSTPFFKCEACPYMALAEDDIKFHLFTVHPDLAKKNGLADNVQIACPGCTSYFDAEETLRNHLRNHHKMGIKDIKKMIKSLVQIALKDATLKRENPVADTPPPTNQELDVKIPEVIDLAPNISSIDETTGKTITFIRVSDLQNLNTNNIEKVNPNHMIQEASIDIVYSDELPPIPAQYMNVSEANTPTTCNLIQLPSAPPDLISCIQPTNSSIGLKPMETHNRAGRPIGSRSKDENNDEPITEVCSKGSCHLRMKSIEKLTYHRQCHRDGKLQCKECDEIFITIESLHTHLWKSHRIDMELPTCDICGYKTYKKHILFGRHMKCHSDRKDYTCETCSKKFKNSNQLSKHRLIHKDDKDPITCTICQIEFPSKRRWKMHVSSVHEKLKPFQCPYCDYAAKRKEDLKLHLRSHTGDKPYSCDQCTYKSSDHNALRRHKKLHTKENLYKCKHCPYTTIQSTVFASHMISTHPNITEEIHRCPFCKFKSISKEKYVNHLTTHPDKEGIKLLIEMNQDNPNKVKPSWTIPSQSEKDLTKDKTPEEKSNSPKSSVNEMPIEVFDCDSQTEPQAYPKNYSTHTNKESDNSNFSEQSVVTDLSKDDTNSDCLITDTTNESLLERHQYNSQHLQNIVYDNNPSTLHYMNPTVTLEQSILQNNIIDSLPTSHATLENRISNIMSNFPIRLPLAPPLPLRNNFTLKAINKIPLQMSKVMGPIIKPTQILPVPLSSNSPVSSTTDPEGVPRKKPKISVKSNLILKGPDQDNMFHSQQKLAFKRLEDNERFGIGPVTFNNLITNQYMQQPIEPILSDSPNNIIPYPQETLLRDTPTTPEDQQIKPTNQIFSFNQQMNVNPIPLLPPQQKIQTSSYIKMETTIKQNTQSPSLERMCSANAISQVLTEYKASPPLEDIHKNMSEIKNEVKSDFYSIPLNNSGGNSIMDQYLMDNLIGEQYVHIDLPNLQDMESQQPDVIEIDDNSDDTKILPRLEMNFPLDSYYLMHNDFHFLENDMPNSDEVRMSGDNLAAPSDNIVEPNDYSNVLEGRKDPMMNVSVRPCTNKINVKNIELMKN